ncbi:MAG: biopolymer transporter ExbD [Armatimonadaceae bacterium]
MPQKRRMMKQTKVEIIPMIDTMFFLLVFFILSSVGVIKLQAIDINLPKPSDAPATPQTTPQEKPDEIIVAIGPTGAVSVNAKPAPQGVITDLIQQELQAQIARKNLKMSLEEAVKDATVVISADPAAAYNIMVNMMDQARSMGITKFALAALQPDQ